MTDPANDVGSPPCAPKPPNLTKDMLWQGVRQFLLLGFGAAAFAYWRDGGMVGLAVNATAAGLTVAFGIYKLLRQHKTIKDLWSALGQIQ